MAKMAATAASHLLPKFCFPPPHYLQPNPTIKFPTASLRESSRVQASNPKREQQDSGMNNNTSEEDLKYLVKLGGGSVVGAAVIKYGSIIAPEITRPNIVQALVMVSAPVVVAVWILLNQSRRDRDVV